MPTIVEKVFLNRDNINEIIISQGGVPVDFTNATRMILFLVADSKTIDSDITPAAIDWATGSGSVKFDLTGESITTYYQSARLIVYDASHPQGQVFIHENNNVNLAFQFYDT